MFSRFSRTHASEQGFTLIELMITIIVMGILAGIAFPLYLNQQRVARDTAVQSDVKGTAAEVHSYLMGNFNVTNVPQQYIVTTNQDSIVVTLNGYGDFTVAGSTGSGQPGNQWTDTTASPTSAHSWVYNSVSGTYAVGSANQANTPAPTVN